MAEGPGAELFICYQKVSGRGLEEPPREAGVWDAGGWSGVRRVDPARARGTFSPFRAAVPRVFQPPGSLAGLCGLRLAFRIDKEAI